MSGKLLNLNKNMLVTTSMQSQMYHCRKTLLYQKKFYQH